MFILKCVVFATPGDCTM